MDASLIVTSGAKPAKIALRLPTVIGRSAEAQLKVKQHNVSRKHCEIFAADNQLKIRDLGSSNGTFINGQRIEGEFVLTPGDELTLGSVQLAVVFRTDTAPKMQTPKTESPQTESHPKAERRSQPATEKAHKPTRESGADERPVHEDVAGEDAVHVNISGSAVLNYQDLENGSFIAIELDEQQPQPIESTIDLDLAEAGQNLANDESRIQLDVDTSQTEPVDDDSRLHNFLEGLGGEDS